MTYGLEVYNSRGASVMTSDALPYVFTVLGKKFSLSLQSGGPYYTAYCDFTASPLAMVTMEWPKVIASPPANLANWNTHGPRLQIRSLGGSNYRATVMWGWQEGRFESNTDFRLWVVDHAETLGASGNYGLEVRDGQGKIVFNTGTKLAKITQAGTVAVGGNTILGGDPSTQLLFVHTYYIYRRIGSLIGPWYDDVYVYSGVGWVPGSGFKVSRIRATRINDYPPGWQLRFESAPTGYLLVDKPI